MRDKTTGKFVGVAPSFDHGLCLGNGLKTPELTSEEWKNNDRCLLKWDSNDECELLHYEVFEKLSRYDPDTIHLLLINSRNLLENNTLPAETNNFLSSRFDNMKQIFIETVKNIRPDLVNSFEKHIPFENKPINRYTKEITIDDLIKQHKSTPNNDLQYN